MNIVFITSDQHRGDCYGFEGRRVKTPHLDDLALRGTRFSACITPSVVCQPARASILTGLLPLTHGVRDNGIDLDAKIGEKGFAGALSGAGYQTAFIGKAHFSSFLTFSPTHTPECRFSQENFGADWTGPYMGFEHVELVVEGHNNLEPFRPPAGLHHSQWYYGDGRGEIKNALYKQSLGPDTAEAFQTHYSALPSAWHNSTWIGDRAIDYIRKNHKRPFMMWVSFPDPHHPFDCPEPWSRLHAPGEVDLPAHRTHDFEKRPWWHRAYIEGTPQVGNNIQSMRSGVPTKPPSEEQLRHIIAHYYGMISLIDHQVGRLEALLSELGIDDETLIVFSSDHGEWLGDHGLLLKGPMFYEGLLRVGLIMKGPGIPANHVVQDPVSTLDLGPTFLDYCNVPSLQACHGKSLAGVISGANTRDFAFSEWDLGPGRRGLPLQLRAVRTRDAKLTVELASGEGELYDLSADPDENHNLWEEPGAAALRRRLCDYLHSRPADQRSDPLPYSGIA